MKSIKLLFAACLMLMSSQAAALFMPGGSQSIADKMEITNNTGC